MGQRIQKMLDEERRKQPIPELQRKQKKARRKGIWTAEDIDLAHAKGEQLYQRLNGLPERK